jgi:hypothetical protein
MQDRPRHGNESNVASPSLIVPYQIFSAFTAGLVVLQAFLAGKALFDGNDDYTDYHEIVGGLFIVAMVVQIVMTFPLTTPGLLRRHLLVQNGLVLLLGFVQMWLGYEGRDSSTAAVLHLPLGVFICAYAGGVFSHAWGLRKHWYHIIGG